MPFSASHFIMSCNICPPPPLNMITFFCLKISHLILIIVCLHFSLINRNVFSLPEAQGKSSQILLSNVARHRSPSHPRVHKYNRDEEKKKSVVSAQGSPSDNGVLFSQRVYPGDVLKKLHLSGFD